MGLDASVCCDCFEKGRLRTPPPFPERLYIEENGHVSIRDIDSEQDLTHDKWVWNKACEHEGMILCHHYIGNIATVARLRDILASLADDPAREYPVIWSKVIYNGVHCGDYLDAASVDALAGEVERLRQVEVRHTDEASAYLKNFLTQMEELTAAAQSVQKPIHF